MRRLKPLPIALALIAGLAAVDPAVAASPPTAALIRHFADCLGWLLTDPSQHLANCTVAGRMAGGPAGSPAAGTQDATDGLRPSKPGQITANTGFAKTGEPNDGTSNTGFSNTGDSNTGFGNTGDANTGFGNTGASNTGFANTGSPNTGTANTGGLKTGQAPGLGPVKPGFGLGF